MKDGERLRDLGANVEDVVWTKQIRNIRMGRKHL
jgi:hypothetical protein